jgi:N-acetylneuraminic acid mutarotase
VRHTAAAVLVAAALVTSACGGNDRPASATAPTASGSHSSGSHSSGARASGTGTSTQAAHSLTASTRLRLPVGVSREVVAVVGSDVVVLGGLAPGDTTTARTWRIDTRTAQVRRGASLARAVHDASGAVLGSRAFVFGGGAAATVADVQQWSTAGSGVSGSLPGPRSDSAAVVVNGTAYVVGGFSGSGMTKDVVATTDGRTFRVVGRLRVGVRYPAVAAVAGQVYVVGGALATTEGTAAGAQTAAVQRFDPRSGKVTVVATLPAPLAHAMAFGIGDALYVAGGRRGATAVRAIDEIDLRTGRTTVVGRLPQAVSDAGVAVVGDGVWLVGGETSGPGAPTSAVVAVHPRR